MFLLDLKPPLKCFFRGLNIPRNRIESSKQGPTGIHQIHPTMRLDAGGGVLMFQEAIVKNHEISGVSRFSCFLICLHLQKKRFLGFVGFSLDFQFR